jgi:hypothetical protein
MFEMKKYRRLIHVEYLKKVELECIIFKLFDGSPCSRQEQSRRALLYLSYYSLPFLCSYV